MQAGPVRRATLPATKQGVPSGLPPPRRPCQAPEPPRSPRILSSLTARATIAAAP